MSTQGISIGDEGDDAFPLAPCPNPYRDGNCHHLTCGRCKQHTDNSHQGHYWSWCKVTKSIQDFHFCCPGDCELYGAGPDATPTTTQPQES